MLGVPQGGNFTAAEFEHLVKKYAGVLAQGVPSVSGFLAGFLMGLKM